MKNNVSTKLQGFTLLEILVTLAVAGILAAVAVPTLKTMTINRHADRLVHELQIDIMYARNQSLTFAKEVEITPLAASWVDGWEIKEGTNLLRINNVSAAAGEITTTSSSIKFDKFGRLSSGAAEIKVTVASCSGNRVRKIKINALGQMVTEVSSC